jgi:hypothetical protein
LSIPARNPCPATAAVSVASPLRWLVGVLAAVTVALAAIALIGQRRRLTA